jgi:hypothetical protein
MSDDADWNPPEEATAAVDQPPAPSASVNTCRSTMAAWLNGHKDTVLTKGGEGNSRLALALVASM